jgi:hypothetical protein
LVRRGITIIKKPIIMEESWKEIIGTQD